MRKLTTDESSNVNSITFDTDHIDVEFRIGHTYRYAGCTVEDFRAASAAPSLGAWVQATLVRQLDKHPFVRLADVATQATRSVTAETHALRTIASLKLPGLGAEIVATARAALEGKLPPPPRKEWDLPTVVRGTTDVQGIEWPSILGKRVLSVDEAEAVAYALAGAALSTRDS